MTVTVKAPHDLQALLATMRSAKEQCVGMSIWDRDIKAIEDAIAVIGGVRSAQWLPVILYPDDNSIVLVANPDEGRLPVIAWKVEDKWFRYDLRERQPLDPQPTLYMEGPRLPRASALTQAQRQSPVETSQRVSTDVFQKPSD